MSNLIILITGAIQNAIDNKIVDIEVVQVFGSEVIVIEDGSSRRTVCGDSAYVSAEPAEFHKLLAEVGQIWTSCNPMLGEWQQLVKDEEVSA